MRFVTSLLIGLLCMTSIVSTPTAAASALPEPGTRIRLTARMPERQRWTGLFVSVANDSVAMRVDDMNGALLIVPTLNVTRIEVSRGRHGSSRRLGGAGLAIGAVVGTAIGYLSYRDTELNSIDVYAYCGLLVGSACAVVGAVIGAVTVSEHWRELPLESLRDTARP